MIIAIVSEAQATGGRIQIRRQLQQGSVNLCSLTGCLEGRNPSNQGFLQTVVTKVWPDFIVFDRSGTHI
jgi:hypothetical protein